MSNKGINSVICKMQEGTPDFIARCVPVAHKALPPSSPVPPLHPLCSSYPSPSHLGDFSLTPPSVWSMPPLSLHTGSFSLFSFSSDVNLGREALPDHSVSKMVLPLYFRTLAAV